ncbi:MAG: DUF3039 domain-containing protein [Acidimicrobiia bacterium]|nr:DUF3039 domain-containing protein [Acidimicrobiia bacterium]
MAERTTETIVAPPSLDGDHERFAHYVKKADIVRSNVEGVPVIALCGKRWIPHRDPDRYPVCPTCIEIRNARFGRS